MKVRWQKFGVQYSGVHFNYLKHRQVHPPLDQMKVYGIVFMTVQGILCFDVFFFFFFPAQRYPKNPLCLMKKFLRLVFKVLLCLIQTDVSSFHSQPENSYEVARPPNSLCLDQTSSFLPPCVFKPLFSLLHNAILSLSNSNIPKP